MKLLPRFLLSLTGPFFVALPINAQCDVETWAGTPGGGTASFGEALSLDGDCALVGAPRDNAVATVGGAAYFYERGARGWSVAKEVRPAGSGDYDYFGSSVHLRGSHAAIGAPAKDTAFSTAGQVYLYERGPTGWSEVDVLEPGDAAANDRFGSSVAVDGERVAVGAPLKSGPAGIYQGAVYVFELQGSTWIEVDKLTASDAGGLDRFGSSVALEGGRLAVGSPLAGGTSGRVYVFDLGPGGWSETDRLEVPSSSGLGRQLALSGGELVASAPGWGANGAAHVFELGPTGWTHVGPLLPPVPDGAVYFAEDVGFDGQRVVVGASAPNSGPGVSGSLHVYERDGVGWIHRYALASDAASPMFTQAVDVDGDTLLAGDDAAAFGGEDAGTATLFVLGDGSSLTGEPAELAINVGGIQELHVETCPPRSGQLYVVLGSFSGTLPGVALGGGLVLPLNPDAYLQWTLLSPNQPPLIAGLGVLDGNGGALPAFALPPGSSPALAGLELNHAAVVLDAALGVELVTNAQELGLVATKSVWIVDSAGPSDFDQIEEAIDSPFVLPGDVLHVHPGAGYASFTLDKELHIIAAADERFSVQSVKVDGVGEFTLAGLWAATIEVKNTTGRGRIHDVRTGNLAFEYCGAYIDWGFVTVEDADQLVISNSMLNGSTGHYPESGATHPALSVRRSRVTVVDSVLSGGSDDFCGYHPTDGPEPAASLEEGSEVIFAGCELWAGDAIGPLGFEGPPAVWIVDSVATVRGSSGDYVRGGDGFSGLGPAIGGTGSSAATISGVTQFTSFPLPPWVVEPAVAEPYLTVDGSEAPGANRWAELFGPSSGAGFLLVSTAPDLTVAPLPGYDLLWLDTGALILAEPFIAAGQDTAAVVNLGDPGSVVPAGGALVLQAWFPPGGLLGPFVTNVAEAIVRW